MRNKLPIRLLGVLLCAVWFATAAKTQDLVSMSRNYSNSENQPSTTLQTKSEIFSQEQLLARSRVPKMTKAFRV